MRWKEEAQRRLQDYPTVCLAVDNIKEEIRRLEAAGTAISSVRTDLVTVRQSGKRKEDQLLDNILCRQELTQALEDTKKWIAVTNKALDALDPEEKVLLQRMYIKPVAGGVSQLCMLMNMEKSNIYRKRDRALRKFATVLYGTVAL